MQVDPTNSSPRPLGSRTVIVFLGAIIAFFFAHYLYDIVKETLGAIRSNSSELLVLRERIAVLEKASTKPAQLLPSPIGDNSLRLPADGPLPPLPVAPSYQTGNGVKRQPVPSELEVKTVSLLNEKKMIPDTIPEPGHFVLLGEEKNSAQLKSVVSNPGQEAAIKLRDKK